MKSFDDWYFELFESGNGSSLNQQEIAEEAWDFRQAEVDELKRELLNKTNEAYADGQRSMRKIIKSNEDELQKRIDDASNKSKNFYDFGDGESAMAFCNEIINILKGDQS